MQASIDLPADPASVGTARQIVRCAAQAWGIGWNDFNAELLTSEIVTRAVRTSPTPVTLLLWLRGPYLRVEVHDGEPLPADVAADDDEAVMASRLSLAAISNLADRWGYDQILHRSRAGKCLWFELVLSPPDWPVDDPGPYPHCLAQSLTLPADAVPVSRSSSQVS